MDKIEWVREFIAELREILTPERIWAWLTENGGLRLIMLVVIVPLLVMAEHFHWFR